MHHLYSVSEILDHLHYDYTSFFFLEDYLCPPHLLVFLGFYLVSIWDITFCFFILINLLYSGFHSSHLGLCIFLLVSDFWWIRLRSFFKLPDGRDLRWKKLSLALVGRAMVSTSLIQLSADVCLARGDPALDSTGSIVGLMAPSKRTYTKESLPGLLLPVTSSQW